MLDPYIAGVLSFELANPARIPQFAGDAEILTATNESIRATTLGSGRDSIGGEIVLFTSSNRDKPVTESETHKTQA